MQVRSLSLPPSDSSIEDTDSTTSSLPPPPSSSFSSSRLSDLFNFLCIPLLISLSKESTCVSAHSEILLPSETVRLSPSCPAPDLKLNFRPVIGILSHPGDGASGRLNNQSGVSYIAASYVKFVESAGARVIPLIYNERREILFNVREYSFSIILVFFFQ